MTRTAKGRRLASWIGLSLLAIVALCLLSITVAFNSETASRKLLQAAAGAMGIDSGKISGTLVSGIHIETLHFSNRALDIRIDRLQFDWEPSALLYGTGKFRSVRADDVHIRHATRPRTGDKKKTRLDDFAPPLRIVLAAAEIHDLKLDYPKGSMALNYIRLDAALGSRLAVKELLLEAPAYRLAGSGTVDSSAPYAAELALDWRYRHNSAPGPVTEFAGTAGISGDIRELKLAHTLSAPGVVVTKGSIVPGFDDAAPYAELHNHWNDLEPPFIAFAINTGGELHVSGWLDDFRLQGQGELSSPALPAMRFALNADGNKSGLDKLALDLDTLNGRITANGSLRWQPAIEWRADLATAGIDLRTFHRHLPQGLQLDLHSAGARTEGRWRGRFERIRGAAQLRNHTLRLQGELAFDGASFSSPGLRLNIAENSMTLSGSIGRRFDLQWQCQAPRLSALWPGLAGALTGDARITGSRDSPRIDATLNAGQLAYANYRIARLNATLRTPAKQQYALNINAQRISLFGRRVSAFTLHAGGDAGTHHIEGRVQDDVFSAAIALSGGYKNSGWRGQLRQADWQAANLPAWSLQQPAAIALRAGDIHIEKACWSAAGARMCTQFDSDKSGAVRTAAELSAVPAGLFDAWLGPQVTLNGLINGSLSLSGPRTNLSGKLVLQADSGAIGVRREGAPTESYRWESAFIRGELRNQLLSASVGADFPEHGTTQGALSINLQTRALDGDIAARFDSLAPLQTVLPGIEGLHGSLQAALKLAGTVSRPKLAGSLTLDDTALRIPRLGIQIRNLQLAAQSAPGGSLVFKGQADSGNGHLRLDGTLAYGVAPVMRASITGEDFEILRLPEMRARVNPRLDVEARPASLKLSGAVLIPSMQIDLRTPPESAVTISDDVIILDAPQARDDSFEFTSEVELILGEDVRLQGFGFNAALAGQLNLHQTAGRPPIANGELTVKEGQYKAFGQQLEIERGRLLFQGAYDNPGLDILALRRTPDVTVSLEIGGTLENPNSRVFSEPPLPDSEAMAILLTGKPLDSASKSDANALVNAITGLGLRKAKFITDDIARAFNLDEFNIKSESDVTTSSLSIGKRISPRLFIRYIVGLFDQTSAIGLSYQLSEQLRVEAESGWNQSMDLIYEIER